MLTPYQTTLFFNLAQLSSSSMILEFQSRGLPMILRSMEKPAEHPVTPTIVCKITLHYI